jgi:hypothetical protein
MLSRATGDFHQDNKLGEGGFGVVYKVILSTSCMPFYHHTSFIYFQIFNLSFYFDLICVKFPINNAYHFFVYFVGNLIGWDKIGSKAIDNKISPRH